MADGNNYRYRRSDDYSRSEAGQGDPLAELARLIGQNDPYSDFARNEAGRTSGYGQPAAPEWSDHAPARHEPAYPPHPEPPVWSQPRYDDQSHYGQQASAYGHQDSQAPDSRYAQYDDAGRYDAQYRPHDPYQPNDPYQQPHDPYQQPHETYPAHDPYQGHDPYQARETAGYAGYQADPRYGAMPGHDPQQGYADDPYYGAMPGDEQIYEQRRPQKRGGLVTVAAVLALAVLGTAGAYAYRTVFGKSGAPLTPPVIKADPGPNKVVPANQTTAKISDRVGEGGQPERIVSREEQPVDIRNAPMRTILPGAPNPVTGLPPSMSAATMPPNAAAPFGPPPGQSGSAFNVPAAAPPAASAPAPAPAQASTEPRKIKTVPIRPDQSDAAEAPTQRAPARTASAEAARPRAQASDSNAPLSLSPATAPRGAAPAAPARTASVAPQSSVVDGSAFDGAYSVQVTSQRSEADAMASWQSLQSRYPSVLGNRQATIRRADLGARGVYYRALVGPFASSGEANDMCSSLKSAGGQCVIQRN